MESVVVLVLLLVEGAHRHSPGRCCADTESSKRTRGREMFRSCYVFVIFCCHGLKSAAIQNLRVHRHLMSSTRWLRVRVGIPTLHWRCGGAGEQAELGLE